MHLITDVHADMSVSSMPVSYTHLDVYKRQALSRRTNGEEYPKYTPDFIKLAESYGAKGIRVTKREEIAAAFEEARKSTKVPTVIEFIIDPEEMVYPMVKPGGTLADLIMDC